MVAMATHRAPKGATLLAVRFMIKQKPLSFQGQLSPSCHPHLRKLETEVEKGGSAAPEGPTDNEHSLGKSDVCPSKTMMTKTQ